jgi:hypothetical protein
MFFTSTLTSGRLAEVLNFLFTFYYPLEQRDYCCMIDSVPVLKTQLTTAQHLESNIPSLLDNLESALRLQFLRFSCFLLFQQLLNFPPEEDMQAGCYSKKALPNCAVVDASYTP